MKIECNNLTIGFDLRELAENLSQEERALFFEHVLFEKTLLQFFADIATSDYALTSGLYSTTYSSGEPVRRLADSLRKIVLSNLDGTYKKQIENMQRDLDGLAKKAHDEWTRAFGLERKIEDLQLVIRELRGES